jgi:RDD family
MAQNPPGPPTSDHEDRPAQAQGPTEPLSGRSLPYVRAFVRALVSSLSALALFLGYLWMLWEPRRRTWHDIVADSLVVRATAYPPGEFGQPVRRDRVR